MRLTATTLIATPDPSASTPTAPTVGPGRRSGWRLRLLMAPVPRRGVPFDGNHQKAARFYVRIGNGTREITDEHEQQKNIAGRWGNAGL